MRAKSKKKAVAAVLATALALTAVGVIGMNFFGSGIERSFTYSSEVFGNPLMGFAPSAWYKTVGDDINLLYMDITWRELEPQEGVFDWESIEEQNQLERWKSEGKRIVLRFVCDLPDDSEHLDIPDWLYDKIGGAGTKYHSSYGYGFSPDYNNPDFIEYHKKAVSALGERYGKDDFIAFVELGSLGHWGEWHVRQSAGIKPMPLYSVREQYVAHWVDAFPNAHIMMRRPFAEAKNHSLGLFNDMAGHESATLEWLDWIKNGGEYDQTGEKNGLVAMGDYWKTSPVGGELTSSIEMRELLVTSHKKTASLIAQSHTTFLGPKIADKQYKEGYDELLSSMGYRIWISDMKLTPKLFGGVKLTLTWQNSGVAPIYADWQPSIQIIDENYSLVGTVDVDLSLSQLLPGESIRTETTLNGIKSLAELESYTLKLGITDPLTGEFAVKFAVDAPQYADGLVLWDE